MERRKHGCTHEESKEGGKEGKGDWYPLGAGEALRKMMEKTSEERGCAWEKKEKLVFSSLDGQPEESRRRASSRSGHAAMLEPRQERLEKGR